MTGDAPAEPAAAPAAQAAEPPLDPARDPNNQLRKVDFATGADKNGPVDPHLLTPLRSPYTLSAGSVISASLITGLRSDLPGLVTAQITERIFDTATGRIELIPQGARLIGTYDSVVVFGQSRALVVWQRIILPEGSSLQIDNVPATDPAGYFQYAAFYNEIYGHEETVADLIPAILASFLDSDRSLSRSKSRSV